VPLSDIIKPERPSYSSNQRIKGIKGSLIALTFINYRRKMAFNKRIFVRLHNCCDCIWPGVHLITPNITDDVTSEIMGGQTISIRPKNSEKNNLIDTCLSLCG